MEPPHADDLPERLVLYPARGKTLGFLALCAAFTVFGALMIRDGDAGGGPAATFFGLCTLVAIVMLLPGSTSLTLERDGFTVRNLFRTNRTRWLDASPFAPISTSGHAMIAYDEAARVGGAASLSRGLTGGASSAIPQTYGLAPHALAALLNRWRERAHRAHGSSA